jgi:RNA polymerase sigma-70 factor (ECF subfamily)
MGDPSVQEVRPVDAPAIDLERVRARDPEALAALFERYFDRVYGLVYRLLGDRTLAEDMTQEVFLKVHRAAHQLDPSRDPGPWLMTIAHNACRDLWRSNAWKLTRRAASLDGDAPLAAMLSHGTNDPERDLLASERERLVQEALLRLPEPLRVAIVMHDYQGLGHEEIAATGIHHAAARKRYSRALAALARLLKGSLG